MVAFGARDRIELFLRDGVGLDWINYSVSRVWCNMGLD